MQQRAWSANFESVSRAADLALTLPKGIFLEFTLNDFPTPEACKHAARSFQKSFTALRARERRRAELALHENSRTSVPIISSARGQYCGLSCVPEPKEDGSWIVRLIPAQLHMANMRIRNADTGEEIEMFNPDEAELGTLISLSMKPIEERAFTQEQWKRTTELDIKLNPGRKRNERWNFDMKGNDWRPESSCFDYRGDGLKRNAEGAIINSEYDVANVSAEDMFKDHPND